MCCLHNIIRITGGDDIFDELWRKDSDAMIHSLQRDQSHDDEAVIRKAFTILEIKHAFRIRNDITKKMELQYSKR